MRPRTVLATPLTALGGWSGPCVRLAGAVCTLVPGTGRWSVGLACREWCDDREDLGRFAVGERGMRPRTVLATPLTALGGRFGPCVRLAGAVCTLVPGTGRWSVGLACRERCYDREDRGRFVVGERGMRARTAVAAPLAGLGARASVGWSGLVGAVCTAVPGADRPSAGSVRMEHRYVRVPRSAA